MRSPDPSRHSQVAASHAAVALAAELAGRTQEATDARFWQGVALHGSGRLREALTALAAIATCPQPTAISSRIRHMALSRAVLVAMDVPVRLDSIERAILEVERIESHTGTGRTSRLLLLKARLAQARGQPSEALRHAREGFTRAAAEDAGFALGTYLKESLRACLRLGALDDAEVLMAQWDHIHDGYVQSRRIFQAAFRSMIARQRGDLAAAVEWGARSVELAEGSDDLSERTLAGEAYVRALLVSARTMDCRRELARLMGLRHSEVGATRYETHLLHADYHLALARFHAGWPTVDPTTGSALETPATRPDDAAADEHRRRARRALRSALEEGNRIDRLFKCDARSHEVTARERLLVPHG